MDSHGAVQFWPNFILLKDYRVLSSQTRIIQKFKSLQRLNHCQYFLISRTVQKIKSLHRHLPTTAESVWITSSRCDKIIQTKRVWNEKPLLHRRKQVERVWWCSCLTKSCFHSVLTKASLHQTQLQQFSNHLKDSGFVHVVLGKLQFSCMFPFYGLLAVN